GGGHYDHVDARLETVHLRQQLVEGLFAFVVRSESPWSTPAADGVDLVDKDDRRALFAGVREQVADPRRPDPDEHLDETGAAEGEERHTRLPGDGSGQQCLPGTRRPD